MTRSGSDSGIQAVGQVPLGTHFCQFYRTKQDLIDTLVPYFTAGLRSNELCLWVTSDPLRAAEATALMHEAMPDFEDFLSRGQIEILDYEAWYLRTGGQDGGDTLTMWIDWERRALAAGYEGLRLTGNTFRAGAPPRRPDPPRPGGLQPLEQRRQIHERRGADLAHGGAP